MIDDDEELEPIGDDVFGVEIDRPFHEDIAGDGDRDSKPFLGLTVSERTIFVSFHWLKPLC